MTKQMTHMKPPTHKHRSTVTENLPWNDFSLLSYFLLLIYLDTMNEYADAIL